MAPKKKVTERTAPPAEDVSMEDASHVASEEKDEEPFDEHNPATLPRGTDRIKILPGSSETAASFEFQNEDHTLGNALRYIIMKNPDVEFCGYSIPHPSENVMNIRIQTYKGTAFEALEKGFDDLEGLCGVVADTFSQARAAYIEGNVA